MDSHAARGAVATLLFALAAPLFAATYIIPPDADFIRSADAIAIVTIQSSHSYRTDDASIATDYAAVVERSLKSPLRAGAKITVTQRGGTVGQLSLGVSSEPQFQTGERTLLVLSRLQRGSFSTLSGELGKFSFVTDVESRSLLVRGASGDEIFGWDLSGRPHIDRPRGAAAFVRYIEAVVAGDETAADYFVHESVVALDRVSANSHVSSPYEYLVSANARWQNGSFTMENTNTQPGEADTSSVVTNSMGGWNDVSEANINIAYGGVNPSGTYGNPDQLNFILFNQPNSGPLAGSPVGIAQYWFDGSPSGSHVFNGHPYATMVDCDIIVETGFNGGLLQAILGHEIGHCLGFRHSNQPQSGQTTNTTVALMNSSVTSDASLRDWDRDAATHTYGSGAPVCNAPGVSAHPQGQTIIQGQSAQLSVTASGTGPFTYQWYRGSSGETGDAIANSNASSINVQPAATQSYWVRVSHACSGATANSNTAVITVTPFVCPDVTVGAPQPVLQGNGTYRLSVSANSSGQSLTYQWFQGTTPGSGGILTGTGTPIFIPLPTVETSFWVRVINGCGNEAVSTLVTIPGCELPIITSEPSDQSIISGSSATLSIAFNTSTAATVRWYRGTVGNKTSQLGTGNSVNTGALTSTSQFWAAITNQCNEISSRQVTVNVGACELPTITTQPSDQSIANGAAATLTLAFNSSTTGTVRWYRGILGDKTNQLGTGLSVSTGALTATTQFWASITNQCGEISSRQVTINVGACELPAITTQPSDQSIANGAAATLTLAFNSSTTGTVRWYRGLLGDKTNQHGTGLSLSTGALTATTQFWAGITNTCGEVSSRQVTVTVGAACTRPAITAQSSVQNILKNQTVTLGVTATGTAPLTYQWYEGAAGTTNKPVGTNSPAFTSNALPSSTSFWVKVTNACGDASSTAIVVNVNEGRRRAAGHRG